jgi:3D (Asp-Asp-Asp) domain-containing protein
MTNLKQYLKLAKIKLIERLVLLILLLALASFVAFPAPVFADTELANFSSTTADFSYQFASDNQGVSLIQIINPGVIFYNGQPAKDSHLPQNSGLEAKYAVNEVLTAYTSEAAQTDDSPCITANGFDLCKHGREDTVAINGVKMGTRVRFPELFGNRVFVVRDRMNSRYGSNRADVWMLSKANAISFGVRVARMEVLE